MSRILAVLTAILLATPAAGWAQCHSAPHDGAVRPTGEPRSTPHQALSRPAGAWCLTFGGYATAGGTWSNGPRGTSDAFGTNMLHVAAARPAGGGALEVRLRMSAEPVLGRSGHPLLLQTGESADGLVPLRDRQHPHDLIAEAGMGIRMPLPDDLELLGYAALVGEPAFGPVAFMHRGSAAGFPEAPLAHHLQDGTHITAGVLTAGVRRPGAVTIEASVFNGLEPDGARYGLDRFRLDSYSVRGLVEIGEDWVVQGSAAQVGSPERLHPTINHSRLSLSITHNRALSRGNWQTTLAVGRTKQQRRVISLAEATRLFSPAILAHYVSLADLSDQPADSLFLVFPTRVKAGWLLESGLVHGAWSLFGRLEQVDKDELFDPSDLRHSEVFGIGKASVGLAFDAIRSGPLVLGVGGQVALHRVPERIRTAYGNSPASQLLFARIQIVGDAQ